MNDKFFVSVAMCTYNGARYVTEQLASLADQERPPDELVICDDRSTDDTVALLHRFKESAPFEVTVEVNERSLGVVRNFDRAVSLCHGNVIFLCDQDDIWYRAKIRMMTDVLASDPSIILTVSNNRIVAASGQPAPGPLNWEACGFDSSWQRRVEVGDGFRVLSFHSPLAGHAMAFRSSLKQLICPFPDNFHHDRWIALMASAVGRVRLIAAPLNDYRQHDRNLVGGGVSALSLIEQSKTAQALPGELFQHKADVYMEAKRRLAVIEGLPAVDLSTKIQFLNQLIAFNQARRHMRLGNGLLRLKFILGEVLRLRYWSCGRGWLTLMRDLAG